MIKIVSSSRSSTINKNFTGRQSSLMKERSRKLLFVEVDIVKVKVNVKKMLKAYNDKECIRTCYNNCPQLFEPKMESLINAKHLAIVRELNSISQNGFEISTEELYYSWLLFRTECKSPTWPLLSLSSFYEFQKSWLILSSTFCNAFGLNEEYASYEDWSEEDYTYKQDTKVEDDTKEFPMQLELVFDRGD